MTRLFYRAAIPVGPDRVSTVTGLLIDPLVVLSAKPMMLLDRVFDT